MRLLLKYTLKSGELIKTGQYPHPPEAVGKISDLRHPYYAHKGAMPDATTKE